MSEAARRLFAFSRKNRIKPNPPERTFRGVFKKLKTGYTIWYQKVFLVGSSGYIVDFYIPELRLVFEIDGKSHNSDEARAYDARRTSYLGTKGIRVHRFTNKDTRKKKVLAEAIQKVLSVRVGELGLDGGGSSVKGKIKAFRDHPRTREEELRMQEEFIARNGVNRV